MKIDKKKMKIAALVAFILILVFNTIGYGFIGNIVFDPKVEETIVATQKLAEKTKYAQFIQTVGWIKTQYLKLKEHHEYVERMNGQWMKPLKNIAVVRATLASYGVDLESLGWNGDLKSPKDVVRLSEYAIDDLKKISEGKASDEDLKKVRDSLETIYGDVPNTQNGSPVKSAYMTMSKAIAFNGESNKAIKEMNKNVDETIAEAESGNMVPGDMERKMLIQQSMAIKAQLGQQQSSLQTNELLIEMLGSKSKEQVDREENRLRELEKRRSLMKNIMFSPAMRDEEGQE